MGQQHACRIEQLVVVLSIDGVRWEYKRLKGGTVSVGHGSSSGRPEVVALGNSSMTILIEEMSKAFAAARQRIANLDDPPTGDGLSMYRAAGLRLIEDDRLAPGVWCTDHAGWQCICPGDGGPVSHGIELGRCIRCGTKRPSGTPPWETQGAQSP